MKNWYDETTGLLRIEEMLEGNANLESILEDGIVTDEEVREQSVRVFDLFREAHRVIDESQRDIVSRLITELCVFHAVSQYRDMTELRDHNFPTRKGT